MVPVVLVKKKNLKDGFGKNLKDGFGKNLKDDFW